jgi:Cu(I)/Ag(I) efflux system membrane fusion protein
MKKVILGTFTIFALLLISCNSGSSDKNKSATKSETEQVTKEVAQEEHALLSVKGSCDMCKERIEKTAIEAKGVTLASWDQDRQQLHLHFDSNTTNIDEISKALAAVGHDTDLYKAEQATYDALPGCCKYREL